MSTGSTSSEAGRRPLDMRSRLMMLEMQLGRVENGLVKQTPSWPGRAATTTHLMMQCSFSRGVL